MGRPRVFLFVWGLLDSATTDGPTDTRLTARGGDEVRCAHNIPYDAWAWDIKAVDGLTDRAGPVGVNVRPETLFSISRRSVCFGERLHGGLARETITHFLVSNKIC